MPSFRSHSTREILVRHCGFRSQDMAHPFQFLYFNEGADAEVIVCSIQFSTFSPPPYLKFTNWAAILLRNLVSDVFSSSTADRLKVQVSPPGLIKVLYNLSFADCLCNLHFDRPSMLCSRLQFFSIFFSFRQGLHLQQNRGIGNKGWFKTVITKRAMLLVFNLIYLICFE